MNKPTPIRLTRETDEDKSAYYNKEAAYERQKKLDADKAAFFKAGGKVVEVGE